MSEIDKLLERVKAATGPDRRLDAELWVELGHDHTSDEDWAKRNPGGRLDFVNGMALATALRDYPNDRNIANNWNLPQLTASIDAALALVEKVLPRYQYAMQSVVYGSDELNHIPWCGLASPIWSGVFDQYQGRGKTLPLAILAALLSALKAVEK